ncbi:MAG: thiamine phosphate synthase [Nitriliruptorales bacterium]
MTGFPSLSPLGERRQARLADARIAVLVGTRRSEGELERYLRELCEASVDICRLRDDVATEDELRRAADVFRRVCGEAGALFVVDRLPGLAVQVGADGAHVGAVDVDPDHARRIVGPDLLLGRTVASEQALGDASDEDVDYLDVDAALVDVAAARAGQPWFVAGAEDVEEALRRGARRVLAGSGIEAGSASEGCWALRRALAQHPLR